MRITRVSVENFRCFENFVIDFAGESRLLIGENAIGKSALMSCIARALGRERTFQRNDFLDLDKAISIQVVIGDLDPAQLGVFHEAADFGAPTTLTLGVLAVWDADSEECEVTHGYPTKTWKTSKPVERDAIDIYWISDSRDASRLLQFGARRGVLADLLAKVDLNVPLAKAIVDIQNACNDFAAAKDLATALEDAGKQLRRLVPAVATMPYSIESAASTDLAVLRQLQLALQHGGPALPLGDQSSGLAQLTLFAFLLLSVAQSPGSILLIDEPEHSLHAHSQRALLRVLQALPNQWLLSTHSASLLDRADPRQVVRLFRDGKDIKDARPTMLTDEEASSLRRYMTSQNAEAFFGRKALLVEGISDQYAIDALAARRGKNRDAAGVSIVVMAGAGGIRTYLSLLGPKGLGVELAGLCDVSDEARWSKALGDHGFGKPLDRAAMAKVGFFVCDKDLENVLITTLGTDQTLQVIAAQGDKAAFEAFSKEPAHSGKSLHEQLHDFIHARNVIYAALLVDALDLANVPPPLEGVVDEI